MRQAPRGYLSLSRAQLDCLHGTAMGLSSKDIGSIVGITAAAVDETIELACERLGVQTRLQAIFVAFHAGLMHRRSLVLDRSQPSEWYQVRRLLNGST
jgi:DNA-binding CsgD family transcriptional regulator